MLAQQIGVSILFESNVREDVQNRRLQRLQMDDFFLWGNFQFVYLKESLSKDLYTDFFQDFQNMVTEHAHLPTVPYQFNWRISQKIGFQKRILKADFCD